MQNSPDRSCSYGCMSNEQASPETTDVVGYFNNNSYPVVLNLSSLNLNVQVGSKKYLCDSAGKKINDPILRRFARAYGLSVEISKQVPVPIIHIARPDTIVQSAGFGGVANTTAAKAEKANAGAPIRTRTTTPLTPPTKSPVTGTNDPARFISRENTKAGNPVQGMTVAEATAKGFIAPTTTPPEGVEDNKLELTADRLPTIDYARDIRKPKPGGAHKSPTKVAAPAEKSPSETAMEDLETLDVGKASRELLAQLEAEAKVGPEAPAPEAVSVPDAPLVDQNAAETATLEEAIAAASTTVPAAVEPEVPSTVEKLPADTKGKFVCAADGKSFPSRSYLERWVMRKYPDRVDELMANFPAKPKKAAPAPQS